MHSPQSHIFRFILSHLNIFGDRKGDIGKIRQQTESLTRWIKPHAGVSITQVQAGTVPAEWTVPQGAPTDTVLLYIHGGAWFMCSPGTHRGLVSSLAFHSRTRALSLDYRLAPEHPFPAALDDCLEAYHWLLQSGIAPGKIVVAGDSAGGNLTLALLVALRDGGEPLPAGAACLSPATDLAETDAFSTTKAVEDPILGSTNKGGFKIIPNYVGDTDRRHPLISPLYADLHGLPPILIHVGEDEILLDDATRFVAGARAAGVEASLVIWPGMWHVFQAFTPMVPEASQSLQQIGKFVLEKLINKPENAAGK
jgi:monoterpene epsilon-lactone hydrolase